MVPAGSEIEELTRQIIARMRQGLPEHLRYHSPEHTLRVKEKAEIIAAYEGINGPDFRLLQLGALLHDIGFLQTETDHEAMSCQMAKEILKDYALEPFEMDQLCGLIMATKIPQSPKNLLEEILADADLEYLGTPDFGPISELLYLEIKHRKPEMSISEWNELQIGFIEKHTYFTGFGKKYLNETKLKHLEELKATHFSYRR